MDIKNRTSEFQRSVLSYKKLNKSSSLHQQQKQQLNEHNNKTSKISSFQKNASVVANEISQTAQLLSKLAILAKRKPMFNDNPIEIAELSFLIKRKIYSIEQQLIKLNQSRDTSNTNKFGDTKVTHSGNVVNLLNRKMKNISGDFKHVLEERRRLELSNRDRWGKANESIRKDPVVDNANIVSNGEENNKNYNNESNLSIGYNSSNPFMSSLIDEM